MENIEKLLAEIKGRREERVSRFDFEWNESLHKRAKNGQFAKMSGGGESAKDKSKSSNAKVVSSQSGSSNSSAPKGNSRLTSTTKTKSGVSYPALKPGASYLSALDVAEKTAREDEKNKWIPKGTWDKVIKSLKPSDVVYQKNEDGVEVASIPGLAAMVDSHIKGSEKMKGIFQAALADEKKMTPSVMNAAKDAGMYLDGLENSAKGASHIEDKAKRKLEDFRKEKMADATEDDVANNFGDMVRYTAITEDKNLIEGTKKLCASLEKQGYRVAEIDNKFLKKDGSINDDAVYRAIHITVETPSGRNVEVQVHSKETLAVKDINHEIYEKQRDLEKTKKEDWTPEMHKQYADYDKQMLANWKKYYKNPEGIDKLSSFDKRNKTIKKA